MEGVPLSSTTSSEGLRGLEWSNNFAKVLKSEIFKLFKISSKIKNKLEWNTKSNSCIDFYIVSYIVVLTVIFYKLLMSRFK